MKRWHTASREKLCKRWSFLRGREKCSRRRRTVFGRGCWIYIRRCFFFTKGASLKRGGCVLRQLHFLTTQSSAAKRSSRTCCSRALLCNLATHRKPRNART